MWCVLYAKEGNEVSTEEFLSGLLSKSVQARCFHLTRDRLIKYSGTWHTVNERLLPGYVFIDTDEPEKVYRELKKTSKRLLFSNDEYIAALDESEASFIKRMTGGGTRIPISMVRMGSDRRLEYLSGPLLEVADQVRRVDLHKRYVEIDAGFMGSRQTLRLGIEFEE